jgi:O-antigen/teichoic acid export membrane protein
MSMPLQSGRAEALRLAGEPYGGSGGTSRPASRGWVLWGAVAVLDQGVASGTTFAANVLLARWLSADAYGGFALAFSVVLMCGLLHNALVLEPFTVFAPSRYADRPAAYAWRQLGVHVALTLPAAGALGAAGAAMKGFGAGDAAAGAFLGAAAIAPCLLLLWFARRVVVVLGASRRVLLAGSVGYALLTLAGLELLHRVGALTALTGALLLAATSLAAAGFLLAATLGAPARRGDGAPSWRATLAENWRYGRWIVAHAVLQGVSTQVQLVFTTSLVGLGAAGALRAMEVATLPMSQIITAVGSLALPRLAGTFQGGDGARLRARSRAVSLSLAGLAAGYALALWAAAPRIEAALYGGKYAGSAWMMPAFGLVWVVAGLTTGWSLALRAIQRPEHYLIAAAVTAPAGIASAALFVGRWGAPGAIGSQLLTAVAAAVVTGLLYRAWVPRRAGGGR